MQKRKLQSGREFYYAEEVDEKIRGLENKITELESELSKAVNSNRGGNVANLTPRKPIYDEDTQREIAQRVMSGESKSSLSKEYNVSRGTILNYYNKFGFTDKVSFNEKLEILKRFENFESIEKIRETTKADSPRISDKAIRHIIAEKYGTDLFCERCEKNTQHVPRVRGGLEGCIECGNKVLKTNANNDMAKSNSNTSTLDDFDIDSLVAEVVKTKDSTDAFNDIPTGQQTNIMGGQSVTDAQKSIQKQMERVKEKLRMDRPTKIDASPFVRDGE